MAQSPAAEPAPGSIPIVYVTDLHHPHSDPDDHFDLATLFGILAFDIKAIIIDTGKTGEKRPGMQALQQMMHMAGKNIPYATGLSGNLTSQADTCEKQPHETQGGVNLILKVLKEADKPVTIFETGSLRDLAAAYNREPALFRAKVGRFYINAGNTAGGPEYNVEQDPHAYVRIMNSPLPIYWVPCFGADGFESFWRFRQGDVLEAAPLPLQDFFVYALTKATGDPVAALSKPIPESVREKIWAETRNMWCTGAFLHAAGNENPTFKFQTVNIHLDNNGTSRITNGSDGLQILTFHQEDPAGYATEMTKILKDIFQSGR